MTGSNPEPTPKRSKKATDGTRKQWQAASLALAIPGYLLAGPLVGYALGWCLDDYFGLPSWTMIVGVLLGIAGGLRESYIAIKRLSKLNETERDDR